MDRRTLAAVLLALLAVAWPAAAADGTPSDPLASVSGGAVPVPAALTSDAAAASSTQVTWAIKTLAFLGIDVDGTMCRPYDLTMPGPNTPINDVLVLDPDGCVRTFLRRTIGFPPVSETHTPIDNLVAL